MHKGCSEDRFISYGSYNVLTRKNKAVLSAMEDILNQKMTKGTKGKQWISTLTWMCIHVKTVENHKVALHRKHRLLHKMKFKVNTCSVNINQWSQINAHVLILRFVYHQYEKYNNPIVSPCNQLNKATHVCSCQVLSNYSINYSGQS